MLAGVAGSAATALVLVVKSRTPGGAELAPAWADGTNVIFLHGDGMGMSERTSSAWR